MVGIRLFFYKNYACKILGVLISIMFMTLHQVWSQNLIYLVEYSIDAFCDYILILLKYRWVIL